MDLLLLPIYRQCNNYIKLTKESIVIFRRADSDITRDLDNGMEFYHIYINEKVMPVKYKGILRIIYY